MKNQNKSAQIIERIHKFNPQSLDEFRNVLSSKRKISKFILTEEKLLDLLDLIEADYKVLEINNKRLLPYHNLYFDSDKKNLYLDHHNRKEKRFKVRIRKYLETQDCFLEIKKKKGAKLEKVRLGVDDITDKLDTKSIRFIKNETNSDLDFQPVLFNDFHRITLMNNSKNERVTIDTDISFNNKESDVSLNGLVIIEIKQNQFNRNSSIMKSLKKMYINPIKISKYCIGVVCLFPDIKYNRFKIKLSKINNLIN